MNTVSVLDCALDTYLINNKLITSVLTKQISIKNKNTLLLRRVDITVVGISSCG